MLTEKPTFRLMSAPVSLLLGVLTIIPILILFGLSFTSWSILVQGSFKFSFTNYAERMFADDSFIQSIKVTFYYIIVNTFFQMVLGFVIAFLLFCFSGTPDYAFSGL